MSWAIFRPLNNHFLSTSLSNQISCHECIKTFWSVLTKLYAVSTNQKAKSGQIACEASCPISTSPPQGSQACFCTRLGWSKRSLAGTEGAGRILAGGEFVGKEHTPRNSFGEPVHLLGRGVYAPGDVSWASGARSLCTIGQHRALEDASSAYSGTW